MKQIFIFACTILFFNSLIAQHKPLNPYETIGKKAEVLTLSKGKYQETFWVGDVPPVYGRGCGCSGG